MEQNDTIDSLKKNKMPTYTKKDIARYIAQSRGVTCEHASQWIDTVVSTVRELMFKANPELRIEIRDFGVFEIKLAKSKLKARNPQTGEVICIPPHKKTHFRPSRLLKNFLSQPIN